MPTSQDKANMCNEQFKSDFSRTDTAQTLTPAGYELPTMPQISPTTGDEAGASSLTISRFSLAPAETGSSYPRKLSPLRSLPGLRTKPPDHPTSSYLSNICNQAYVQDGAPWRSGSRRSASRRCVAASAVYTSTGCLMRLSRLTL